MLLSVVLPFRNEELVLAELIQRLRKSLLIANVQYELIFVNDASTDRSLEILKSEAAKDTCIKILNMSRNFGNAPCIMAGFKYACGQAVVYMDADLQDPPELIPELLREYEAGADVVYTTRRSRAGESALKMMITRWAYSVLHYTSTIRLPINSGDFKLLSRRVVDQLIKLNEKDPFIRGLVTWVGFKQVPVYYDREARFAGETHYSIFAGGPYRAFLAGLTSFSTKPLDIALYVGFGLSFCSFVYLVVIVVMFFLGWNIPGWTAIMGVILILGGTQLLTVGFLGIYIGRIYEEVKRRPGYIVESTVNVDGASTTHSQEDTK